MTAIELAQTQTRNDALNKELSEWKMNHARMMGEKGQQLEAAKQEAEIAKIEAQKLQMEMEKLAARVRENPGTSNPATQVSLSPLLAVVSLGCTHDLRLES